MELFETDGFSSKWHCGNWPEWLGYLSQGADASIFFSYMAISVVLAARVARFAARLNWAHQIVISLFASFIFACGLTHLAKLLSWSWPAYRLFVLIDVLCAMASIPVALLLLHPKVRALSMPRQSDDVWEKSLEELEIDRAERQRRNDVLQAECDRLRSIAVAGQAAEILQDVVRQIKAEINRNDSSKAKGG